MFLNKKQTIFLNLLRNTSGDKKNDQIQKTVTAKNAVLFVNFKKHYIALFKIISIYKYVALHKFEIICQKSHIILYFLNYYSKLFFSGAFNSTNNITSLLTYTKTHLIIFSKPRRQLFVVFFKDKPVFIFTGGLMRLIIHEKKKSSKKMLKVATSLIKLTTILLLKNIYFDNSILLLNKLGDIRVKILRMFVQYKLQRCILYTITKLNISFTAQKLNTRRSIKKYVKKRFKLQ